MSDPLYPYSRGAFTGGDGAPPPPRRYSDIEVDLIAARYTSTPPPYPSSVGVSAFDSGVSAFESHVGAFDSHVGAFDSHVGAFDSGVGAFDSHVGAFDSHVGAFGSGVGAFDSHVGAFDSGFSAFDSHVGAFDSHIGARRSAEALYHQSFTGSHSTVGQNEALFSSNTMAKRPRRKSSLPMYPQRPGEKDCAFYMRTRTCKYGEDCKFDHPQWVPKGGVPNWKEVPDTEDFYPERPGEPDCPYFLKSNSCRFKSKCKFNHPKATIYTATAGAKETIYTAAIDAAAHIGAADGSVPAEAHNPKGLPIRPGEADCSFYMKTGSCKYGSTCRFNHPHRPVVDIAMMAPLAQTTLPTPAPIVSAMLNPAANIIQSFDFHATHVPFYMKTGFCKYSQKCKFHHPTNRSAPGAYENEDPQQPVTLTLAGLPRREDAEACAFYMRSGTCRYGVHCKFDHPPPQEAIAKLQATGKEGDKEKQEAKKEGDEKDGLSVVLR